MKRKNKLNIIETNEIPDTPSILSGKRVNYIYVDVDEAPLHPSIRKKLL